MIEVRRPRVVIAGAGFGGLWAARSLGGEPVDVLLLDRTNYHTFFPLLYQVAAAEIGPTEIAYPVRSILRKHRNIRFRMAEVLEVDPESREVVTELERIPYDHLVLALGSEPNYFGVEGAEEHAFPLRWMDQAVPLRHHILSCFEAAVYERDRERRRALLTFAIVGGGPTGLEFAGALSELVRGPLRRDYPMLDPDEIRVLLLEALDRVLPGMSEKLGDYAHDKLGRLGVEVRTGAQVERIAADHLVLADGGERIDTETVVWTAGVKGDDAVGGWGLPVGKGGAVTVDEHLRVPDHPEIRVVGDLSAVEQDGEPVPLVAPAAIQQGEYAAAQIVRVVSGEGEGEPFHYDEPGFLAVVGRNSGVAEIKGRTFTGFAAWVVWLVVHIAKLIGFRSRVLVLVNWAWNYISYGRAVRLILPFGEGRDVEEEAMEAVEEPEPATERELAPRPPASEEAPREEARSVADESGGR